MTEQEAQQAQTKSVHGWLLDMQDYLLPIRLKESIDTGFGKEFGEYLIERCRRAESIGDSQAQNIADLNRVGSNTLMALIESQEKIAEQAKRIAELEKDAAEHVCCLANNGW